MVEVDTLHGSKLVCQSGLDHRTTSVTDGSH